MGHDSVVLDGYAIYVDLNARVSPEEREGRNWSLSLRSVRIFRFRLDVRRGFSHRQTAKQKALEVANFRLTRLQTPSRTPDGSRPGVLRVVNRSIHQAQNKRRHNQENYTTQAQTPRKRENKTTTRAREKEQRAVLARRQETQSRKLHHTSTNSSTAEK